MPHILFEFGAFFNYPKMKTIEDLKKTVYTTKESVNAFGERERVKVPIQLKRKINTVQGGALFGHYLIDLALITAISFGIGWSCIFENGPTEFTQLQLGGSRYAWNFSGYIVVLLYYLISEAIMGRTIGKFATRSYVIDKYAKKPEFGAIFTRSLSRWIPFYALSCLGEKGWHDKLSATYVVTKTEWEALKKELAGEDGYTDDSEILDA